MRKISLILPMLFLAACHNTGKSYSVFPDMPTGYTYNKEHLRAQPQELSFHRVDGVEDHTHPHHKDIMAAPAVPPGAAPVVLAPPPVPQPVEAIQGRIDPSVEVNLPRATIYGAPPPVAPAPQFVVPQTFPITPVENAIPQPEPIAPVEASTNTQAPLSSGSVSPSRRTLTPYGSQGDIYQTGIPARASEAPVQIRRNPANARYSRTLQNDHFNE